METKDVIYELRTGKGLSQEELAEKVQSFPLIACSTASTTSFGKRMVLFVVGGVEGILKLPMRFTSQFQ